MNGSKSKKEFSFTSYSSVRSSSFNKIIEVTVQFNTDTIYQCLKNYQAKNNTFINLTSYHLLYKSTRDQKFRKMRTDYSKPFIHSRLKSYIDGNLKVADIKHPSKITLHEPHLNIIAGFRTNLQEHPTISNCKLKIWSVKPESRIGAYINGEMTIRELVHPSKINELSQQAIQQKIRKNKILKRRANHLSQHKLKQQLHWMELGKQLDRIPSTINKSQSYHSSTQSETEMQCVVPATINEERPMEAKNTLIFNGNVNILCLNLAQKQLQLDYQKKPQQIYQNIHQNILNAIPMNILQTDLNSRPQWDRKKLVPLRILNHDSDINALSSTEESVKDTSIIEKYNNIQGNNTEDLKTTVSMLTSTLQHLNAQYQHAIYNCYELAKDREYLLEYQELSDKAMDKLKTRMCELKHQHEVSEVTILQLSDETEALEFENQSIILKSENTIHYLTEEIAELKRKNEFLVKLSKKAIQQLKKEMKNLKQHNNYLADKLNEEVVNEENVLILKEKVNQLKTQNCNLTIELQQQLTEKNNLNLLIEKFRTNLKSKIANIDQCFALISESIQKTEYDIKAINSRYMNTLLNTIYELDDQNTNLMVKIKLFPEILKRNLARVFCSMKALEEQNGRLIRALQNTETEHLTEANIRNRMKDLKIEYTNTR